MCVVLRQEVFADLIDPRWLVRELARATPFVQRDQKPAASDHRHPRDRPYVGKAAEDDPSRKRRPDKMYVRVRRQRGGGSALEREDEEQVAERAHKPTR